MYIEFIYYVYIFIVHYRMDAIFYVYYINHGIFTSVGAYAMLFYCKGAIKIYLNFFASEKYLGVM